MPRPDSLPPRRTRVVLAMILAGGLGVGGLAVWQTSQTGKAATSAARTEAGAAMAASGWNEVPAIRETDGVKRRESVVSLMGPSLTGTRAEVARALATFFSKELARQELALEQLRYGREPWEPELGLADLSALEESRAALVKSLNGEANALLAELFPDDRAGTKDEGERGLAIALTPNFGVDRAGPYVGGLSAEGRAAFEIALATRRRDDSGLIELEELREIAGRVLATEERGKFLRWNARESVALRREGVGFEFTATEFGALRGWLSKTEFGAADDAVLTAANQAAAQALGAERFAAWQQWRSAENQTTVQALHRLGANAQHAGWLAAARREAMAEAQAVWADMALSPAGKATRLAALQQVRRNVLVARLGIGEGAAQEADLLP